VRRHVGQEQARVRVVAPVSKISPLEWLTNDEDDARAKAEETAARVAKALPPEAEAETEVGDSDPVQAIEYALRTFPADEIVIAVGDDEPSWLEKGSYSEAVRRFGVPVSRITVAAG
jgi:hypothetical protein